MKLFHNFFYVVFGIGVCSIQASIPSFVQNKKTISEKPSQIKEEIVELLESLLTATSELISSVAQQQPVMIGKVKDVAQSQGVFAQPSPAALKRYRDALKKMDQEIKQKTQQLQQELVTLKKDFSERT